VLWHFNKVGHPCKAERLVLAPDLVPTAPLGPIVRGSLVIPCLKATELDGRNSEKMQPGSSKVTFLSKLGPIRHLSQMRKWSPQLQQSSDQASFISSPHPSARVMDFPDPGVSRQEIRQENLKSATRFPDTWSWNRLNQILRKTRTIQG
jgi:hypothetical protein